MMEWVRGILRRLRRVSDMILTNSQILNIRAISRSFFQWMMALPINLETTLERCVISALSRVLEGPVSRSLKSESETGEGRN